MRVGIVGLGNFGSAIGNLIANNGFEVLGWERSDKVVNEINQLHQNNKYLPEIALHQRLSATLNLEEVLESSQVVFVAIPSVFIYNTLEPYTKKLPVGMLLVNLAKGIDAESGLTAFQTISCLFPEQRKVVLSGPSVANEFARCQPTTVVIAGPRKDDLLRVSHLLDNEYFRTRFSEDAIGVELGGILKNIYAIGLGMFDGQNIRSVNFRSVYLTISLEEMARFGVGMGAELDTFLYLSGMGDLLATALSEHSHNRRMGENLSHGYSLAEIKHKMGVLPEGFNTLKTVLYIAEKMHISMPLAKGLWDVIHGHYPAEKFISSFIKDFVE